MTLAERIAEIRKVLDQYPTLPQSSNNIADLLRAIDLLQAVVQLVGIKGHGDHIDCPVCDIEREARKEGLVP